MNKVITTYLMLLSFSLFSQDLWIQRDSLNGPPRSNAAAFEIGDNGYVVSGYDGSNRKRSMVSYDPFQDDWDDEESLGGASGDGLNRASAMSFSAYGFGFVCMGEGTNFIFSDCWLYDPYTESWTQMANFPGEPRTQGISFSHSDKGYVGLGKAADFATFLNDLWSYEYLTNTWTQVADFPGTSRVDAFGVAMGGKAYVGLGRDSTSFPNDVYEYFPADDTWQQIADFPGTPRINTTAFARFPQLFITTGDDGFNYLNDTWEYNYFGDVWTQKTDFPSPGRAGSIAITVDNRYFVGAGYGNGLFYDDFYEYVFVFGIGEKVEISLSTYPNPSNGNFTLKTNEYFGELDFELFDQGGKKISYYKNNLGNNTFQFSLDNPLKGNYYLQVSSAGRIISIQSLIIS